jgi:hypothetical protein
MDGDLQTKLEKYEEKAAKCREAALKAPEGAQRTMYEVRTTTPGWQPTSGTPSKSTRSRSYRLLPPLHQRGDRYVP